VSGLVDELQLSSSGIAGEQLVPPVPLGRVNGEWYPEIRSAARLGDFPAERVGALRRVIERGGTVGEPDWLCRVEVRRAVLEKLRNVALQRVLRLIRKVVRRHDVVDRCHRRRAGLDGGFESLAVGRL
jgi:hypothetical protein